jgi:prepilin-type processing-associated H-X9-DG protein
VWVGAGVTTAAGPDTIIGYEKPDGLEEGINILYADGHVEWHPMEQARDLIEKQQQGRGQKQR